jgi:cytochrome-b5 reductase
MTLVHGVNTEKDILLRRELQELEKRHPGRFRAVYTVTLPEQHELDAKGEGGLRNGRVTKELLNELVPEGQRGRAYICGPPAMEAALAGQWGTSGILQQLGYRKEHIFKF